MSNEFLTVKFEARLKGIIAFIRALALNRSLKLRLSYNEASTDGKSVCLPYCALFGDFDRRYALGIAAHEVAHCLYSDFDVSGESERLYTNCAAYFGVHKAEDFALPLLGKDGTASCYRLKSTFMRREAFRRCDNIFVDYRNAVSLWNKLLNALEDARVERIMKHDRPETAFVIRKVYDKALADADFSSMPFNAPRYGFIVCLFASSVISRSAALNEAEALITRMRLEDEERDLYVKVRTLISDAAVYAQSSPDGGFMSYTSSTVDLVDLATALTDLFITYLEAHPESDAAQDQEQEKKEDKEDCGLQDTNPADIGDSDFYPELMQSPLDFVRRNLNEQLPGEVCNYVYESNLGEREFVVPAAGGCTLQVSDVLLPLEEVTEAQSKTACPPCKDQSALCWQLGKILFPPQSQRFPGQGLRRYGIRLDGRRTPFAANRCMSERLFKGRTATLSLGQAQIAVIFDTSTSAMRYKDEYLSCFELLRKVLGHADPLRLLSSVYCFGASGTARIKRVNEKFDAAIAGRLSYSCYTPGYSALYYALTELSTARAGRKLLLCLTDGEFNDDSACCRRFLADRGAEIDKAGVKLAFIHIKSEVSVFPDGFKPHYAQSIDSAADLPQALLRAVRAVF